jgi:hypothetical protein
MQADGQLKPGMQGDHTQYACAAWCKVQKLPASSCIGPLLCTGKKGISLQQSEWQELRRDDGGCVQAAVDLLLQQSAAAGLMTEFTHLPVHYWTGAERLE